MNWHVSNAFRSTRAAGPLALIASCMLVVLASGCRQEAPPQPTTPESSATDMDTDTASAKTGTVTLEIFQPNENSSKDASDAVQADFTETFDVAAGTTVEEVMRKIEQPKIVITGSGVTAFVQSIDGVATDATRGWTYTIDDKFANEGIGSVKLTPPQKIRWRFTTLEEATK